MEDLVFFWVLCLLEVGFFKKEVVFIVRERVVVVWEGRARRLWGIGRGSLWEE